MSDEPPSLPFEAITILGVPVHLITADETLARVAAFMEEPRLHQIATVNPEFVMIAQDDASFRAVLETADLCLADGIGLVYASRYLGRPLPERVPGSELVYRLAEQAAKSGWSLFLLGAAPGVAEEAAAILQDRYPGLRIAGTYAGSPDPAANEEIVTRINASGAQMLFVAYGAPPAGHVDCSQPGSAGTCARRDGRGRFARLHHWPRRSRPAVGAGCRAGVAAPVV